MIAARGTYLNQRNRWQNLLRWAIVLITIVAVGNPLTVQADLKAELEKKKALQESITNSEQQKKQEQNLVSRIQDEMDKLNTQIESTQATIEKIGNEVAEFGKAITQLAKDIEKQSALVQMEKDKLEVTISSMYIDDQANDLPFFVQEGSISELVSRAQDEQSIAQEIEKKAQEIELLKLALEEQKDELARKQSGLKVLQEQQIQQKRALDSQVSLKNDLLQNSIRTISDLDSTIQSYKNDLKAVDGKISEFLTAMQLQENYQAASGDLIVTNSASWHYYQTDPRWGNQVLNLSDVGSDTFTESGCLVTSLAAVSTSLGIHLTPPQMLDNLRNSGGMYGDLVSWGGVRGALKGRADFVTGGKEAVNWRFLDISLASGFPVIVHINKGRYGHWVVISHKVGDKYAVEDPYFTTSRVYPADWVDYMARLQPIR